MARWSGVGEPDDPLRADDALVGAEHEDVLLGSGMPDDGEPAADYPDSEHDDVDENPTSVAVLDDRPTTEIPRLVGPAPEPPGRFAGVKPWAVFAVVAVVVIATTTTLASWLQGPTAERQSFTGLIQPPTPTAVSAPPAPAEPTTPEPPPSAEPKPEPKPEPAPRPTTQRPRATRAPAVPPPPPPAAAVNAPATPDGEKKEEETAPKTSAPRGPAAADAETPETGGGARSTDVEKDEDEADSSDDG